MLESSLTFNSTGRGNMRVCYQKTSLSRFATFKWYSRVAQNQKSSDSPRAAKLFGLKVFNILDCDPQ